MDIVGSIYGFLSHCCLFQSSSKSNTHNKRLKHINIDYPNVLVKLDGATKFVIDTYIKYGDQPNYVAVPISSGYNLENPSYIQEVLDKFLEYDIESQEWYLRYEVYEYYSVKSLNMTDFYRCTYKSPVEFKDTLEYVSFSYHSKTGSYKPNTYRRFK
jgi:hypothetical protein